MLAVDLAIKLTRTMNQQEWTLMSSKVLYEDSKHRFDWLYDDFFFGVYVYVYVFWSVRKKSDFFQSIEE